MRTFLRCCATALILWASLAQTAPGRMYETPEECASRYGTPQNCDEFRTNLAQATITPNGYQPAAYGIYTTEQFNIAVVFGKNNAASNELRILRANRDRVAKALAAESGRFWPDKAQVRTLAALKNRVLRECEAKQEEMLPHALMVTYLRRNQEPISAEVYAAILKKQIAVANASLADYQLANVDSNTASYIQGNSKLAAAIEGDDLGGVGQPGGRGFIAYEVVTTFRNHTIRTNLMWWNGSTMKIYDANGQALVESLGRADAKLEAARTAADDRRRHEEKEKKLGLDIL